MSKIKQLLEAEGFADELEMMSASMYDSVCPGICTNPDCSYTTSVEPDQDKGWCEECNTNTVKSGLSLMGII